MKPFLRSALFCFALALFLPFAALASGGTDAEVAVVSVSQDEVAMTSHETPADGADHLLSSWLEAPEWTKGEADQSFGSCPGPPAPSCQCGIGLGEPGSEACCYCNTCWDGYVLALCGLDP